MLLDDNLLPVFTVWLKYFIESSNRLSCNGNSSISNYNFHFVLKDKLNSIVGGIKKVMRLTLLT